MPNTKSAKKRLRQNDVRRTRNRAAKSALRTQVKRVLSAASDGDTQRGETEYRVAAKKIDRAAAHNVIHANTASRLKSRLSARLKAAKAAVAS